LFYYLSGVNPAGSCNFFAKNLTAICNTPSAIVEYQINKNSTAPPPQSCQPEQGFLYRVIIFLKFREIIDANQSSFMGREKHDLRFEIFDFGFIEY
jgi:hypothetical protein